MVGGRADAPEGLVLVRFDDGGQPDPSFGGDGLVSIRLPGPPGWPYEEYLYALALLPSGGFVAAGSSRDEGIAVVRLLADGTLDPSFDSGGVVTGPRGRLVDVAVQPDGKLVAPAWLATAGFAPEFGLARFEADGTPDTGFGAEGIVRLEPARLQLDLGQFLPIAVALQADGRIVVGGNATAAFTLARFLPDGSLDPSFGSGGLVQTSFGAPWSTQLRDLALLPDATLVAAGSSNDTVRLARYVVDVCGNGVLEPGEACDDGNLASGDGCDANCTATACGNGVVTAGEACDDGNLAGGDCCDPTCTPGPDGAPCDDGDACSAGDTCDAGRCLAGAPRDCADGETCTTDACDPISGACRYEYDADVACQGVLQRFGWLQPAFTASSSIRDFEPHFGVEIHVAGGDLLVRSNGEEVDGAELRDGRTGALRHVFHDPTPEDDSFGPLATLGDDILVAAEAGRWLHPGPGQVDLYDHGSGALLRTFHDPTPDTEGFGAALLGVGGTVLAFDAGDGAVHVFDAASGMFNRTLVGPTPLGPPLVASGGDVLVRGEGAVYRFDPVSGALMASFVDPTPGSGAFGAGGDAARLGGPRRRQPRGRRLPLRRRHRRAPPGHRGPGARGPHLRALRGGER